MAKGVFPYPQTPEKDARLEFGRETAVFTGRLPSNIALRPASNLYAFGMGTNCFVAYGDDDVQMTLEERGNLEISCCTQITLQARGKP